jgi:hypothetical protein
VNIEIRSSVSMSVVATTVSPGCEKHRTIYTFNERRRAVLGEALPDAMHRSL